MLLPTGPMPHTAALAPRPPPPARFPGPQVPGPAAGAAGEDRAGAPAPGRARLRGAGEGGRRAARAREGTGDCVSASLKVSCRVARPPLCAPSNGPRAAGPGRMRGPEGRRDGAGSCGLRTRLLCSRLRPRSWPESRAKRDFSQQLLHGQKNPRRSPLSRLSQEGGKRWGYEGTRRPEMAD